MQRWVYKSLVMRELALSESKLNTEGEKGWELVAVCMSDATTARAFLKKPYEFAEEEHHHEEHHETHTEAHSESHEHIGVAVTH